MKKNNQFLRRETTINNGNLLVFGFCILGLSTLSACLNLKLLDANLDKIVADQELSELSKKLKESEETIELLLKD